MGERIWRLSSSEMNFYNTEYYDDAVFENILQKLA